MFSAPEQPASLPIQSPGRFLTRRSPHFLSHAIRRLPSQCSPRCPQFSQPPAFRSAQPTPLSPHGIRLAVSASRRKTTLPFGQQPDHLPPGTAAVSRPGATNAIHSPAALLKLVRCHLRRPQPHGLYLTHSAPPPLAARLTLATGQPTPISSWRLAATQMQPHFLTHSHTASGSSNCCCRLTRLLLLLPQAACPLSASLSAAAWPLTYRLSPRQSQTCRQLRRSLRRSEPTNLISPAREHDGVR